MLSQLKRCVRFCIRWQLKFVLLQLRIINEPVSTLPPEIRNTIVRLVVNRRRSVNG